MKRLLIFSDTHGYIDPCIDIINNTQNVAAVIHAGDYVSDAEDLSYIYPKMNILYVRGNNDLFANAPSYLVTQIDGATVFITHGHEQRVKYDYTLSTLRRAASKHNPNLVIFGHTHEPYTGYEDGFITLNPGSVRYSKTYAIAEIESGRVKTKIMEI